MRLGIFDSGVGGLTFASAIKKKMPELQLVYYGDTVHLPYGDKSAESIKSFSKKISEFLIEKGCDAILIACNSASAIAYKHLQDLYSKESYTVYNVIDPVIESLASVSKDAVVGVIGTRATIGSKVYPDKISAQHPQLSVKTYPTPLLAPMIEDGFIHDSISRGVVQKYLDHPNLEGISHLILGCTHYPIIESDFKAVLGNRVELIDPVETVASYLKNRLDLNAGSIGSDHFYVSDLTDSFTAMASLFFGKEIVLEELNIWKEE